MIKGLSTRKKHKLMTSKAKCQICAIEYYGDEIDIDIDTSPLKMTCCKNLICKNCIKSYLSISDTLLCPYCLVDHTQVDKPYIVVIEMSDTIDKEKWKEWWEKWGKVWWKEWW